MTRERRPTGSFDNYSMSYRSNKRLKEEQWSIHIAGLKLTEINKQKIYDKLMKIQSHNYLSRRLFIPPHELELINWTRVDQAKTNWPLGKRIWLAKHISGFSPTAKVMFRRKEWDHDKCPRCKCLGEDAHHIITCQGLKAQEGWDQVINEFEEELNKLDTDPNITKTLVKELNNIRGIADERSCLESPLIQEARRQQKQIGWHSITYSLYSKKWEDAQEEWIQRKYSKWKRSATKWAFKLINASLELSWKMWENRNECLHDEHHPWQCEGENSTNITIQELYEDYQDKIYLERDRKLFDTHVETKLALPLRKKKEWLCSVFAAQTRKRKNKRRRKRIEALSDI